MKVFSLQRFSCVHPGPDLMVVIIFFFIPCAIGEENDWAFGKASKTFFYDLVLIKGGLWVGGWVRSPHFPTTFLLETSRNAIKDITNQGGSFIDAMNPKRLLKFLGYSR